MHVYNQLKYYERYSTYFENPLFMMSNVMSLNDNILD